MFLNRQANLNPPPSPCFRTTRSHKLSVPLPTHLIGREPLITFTTSGELAKWAEIRRWGAHRRGELAAWVSGIPVLAGYEAVAAIWGAPPQQPAGAGVQVPANLASRLPPLTVILHSHQVRPPNTATAYRPEPRRTSDSAE